MAEDVEKQIADVVISDTGKRKVFLVGDSTVSPFKDDIFIPRAGYGMMMQHFLDNQKAEAVNLALAGRSSKSFLKEKNYAILKENLKKGDFLIIAFGHNDEKCEEARYSNAQGGIEDETSFQHFLFTYYIELARARGAIPVLCTPIVRRTPDGVYEGKFVHVTEDSGIFRGGDYPTTIRKLGEREHVIVVDNTELTKRLYMELGAQGSATLHAQLTADPSSIDNTHLNKDGAMRICRLVVTELARLNADFASLLAESA